MANGFFCLSGCRNPECDGCDPDAVPIDWLKKWIADTETQLDVLRMALKRRR